MRLSIENHGMELLKRWRHQLGTRLLRRETRPRDYLAMSYLTDGPVVENLICLDDLILTVLYDQRRADGSLGIRLAGYRGRASTWGAFWGGRSGHKFDKDLSLSPERCARGQRLELTRSALIEHALQLDQLVEQASASQPLLPYELGLPALWAAFRPADAGRLKPAGPEFEALRQRLGMPVSELLAHYRRRHLGMTLLPLEWVSHAWQRWVILLADLGQYPRTQSLKRHEAETQLQGYCGAAGFNLLASRFTGRRVAPRPVVTPRPCAVASA